MRHLFLFAFAFVICLVSCKTDSDEQTGGEIGDIENLYSITYLPGYMIARGMDTIIPTLHRDTIIYNSSDCSLSFQFTGNCIFPFESRFTACCKWMQQPISIDANLFWNLAKANRDTVFNNYVDFIYSPCLGYAATNFSVVSDSDFDEQHPAGNELSDVVALEILTCSQFIDNNYNKGKGEGEKVDEWKTVKKHFSEFTEQEKRLWQCDKTSLYFPKPTMGKRHNFTVVFEFADGGVVKEVFHKEFR